MAVVGLYAYAFMVWGGMHHNSLISGKIFEAFLKGQYVEACRENIGIILEVEGFYNVDMDSFIL